MPVPRGVPMPSGDFGDDHNAFALALAREIGAGANWCCSPLGVRVALAMALAGARGDTAAELARALCLPTDGTDAHVGFAALLARLRAAEGTSIRIANGLWVGADAPLQPDYLARLDRDYASPPRRGDFRRAAESVRRAINAWVDAETQGRIGELLAHGSLSPSTVLVLANAVHFAGRWQTPFAAELTQAAPFQREDGRQVRVPLMRHELVAPYCQADGFQAVDLPYAGAAMSLLVLLPAAGTRLLDFSRGLTAARLRRCVDALQSVPVSLHLPRLRLTWGTADLVPPLRALGVQRALTEGQADFAGINGARPPSAAALWISGVFHQARIELEEQGTVAAAATAVSMQCISARPGPAPVVFRADRPFLFAIRERHCGVVLFLGGVADPTPAP